MMTDEGQNAHHAQLFSDAANVKQKSQQHRTDSERAGKKSFCVIL